MPWLPKGDKPCETCRYHWSKRCHSDWGCSDSPSRKRREHTRSSEWGPGRYVCNVCGEEFSRRDVEPKNWSDVTLCLDCVGAIERGEVQRRLDA